MSTLTPEQRTIRARLAAHSKHAKHDPHEAMAHARAALWDQYHRKADPDGKLDEAERDRRARQLMQCDLAKRALASSRARAQRSDDALADALLDGGAL